MPVQLRQIAMLGGFALALLCSPAVQNARGDATTCAATVASPNPPTVTAGAPCWTDVQPYPFGSDGEPVDASSPQCAESRAYACYLTVQSMAFRAWNRGLALMTPSTSSTYDVWEYNGTDWVPNASFPASSCPGSTILWAGKLDYWVVGGQSGASWPDLCRWDGSTLEWDVLPVPAAALAAVTSNGTVQPGAITSGACFAWNDCWFVGSGGVELHWDGTALTYVADGLGASPWLDGDFNAASVFTDASGSQFAFAIGQAFFDNASVPAQPDGSAPPQVFESAGGAFQATGLEPPAVAGSLAGSYPTSLVALGFNAAGSGWLAGNPVSGGAAGPTPTAPLIPITEAGTSPACPEITPSTFSAESYAWNSVGVLPNGDAVAGGEYVSNAGLEPVLVEASCATGVTQTLFTTPDPTGQSSTPVPADLNGEVNSVVVNADNDAWAGTTSGITDDVNEPPHLYHFTDVTPTDGATVDAPAGNDDEVRTVTEPAQPTLYETPPTVIVPSEPPATVITTTVKRRTVKLPSPIYRVKLASPVAKGSDIYTLTLNFRVRRAVTIGVDALRHGHVVARSGLRTFHKGIGHLTLELRRTAWPTGLRFVLPKKATG